MNIIDKINQFNNSTHNPLWFYWVNLDNWPKAGIYVRRINAIFNNLSKIFAVKDTRIVNLLDKIKNPVGSTKLLGIIGAIENIPKLFHHCHKFVHVEGRKKGVEVLKIANTASSILDGVDTFREGLEVFTTAVKVSKVVSHVFAAIGLVGSVVSLALHVRGYRKTDQQLNEFIEAVRYNAEGNYDKNTCNALSQYIFNSRKKLGKQFGGEGDELFLKLERKLGSMSSAEELTAAQKDDLKDTIETLKHRLEEKRRNSVISLVDDCLGIVESIVGIVALTNPIFFAIWAAGNLAYMAGKHIATQIQDYQFENRMGLIKRHTPVETLSQRIDDFASWYFKKVWHLG